MVDLEAEGVYACVLPPFRPGAGKALPSHRGVQEMNRFSMTFRFLCLALFLFPAAAVAKGKVKVFILAGQSNME